MSPNIIVWGASGQAKVIYEALGFDNKNIAAFVDNKPLATPIEGIPILLGLKELDEWLLQKEQSKFFGVAAIGGNHGEERLEILDVFKERNISPRTIIHVSAYVAWNAKIGDGCQILAHSTISSNAILGDGVILNTAASVDHDCIIEDGVHIGPGARLCGEIVLKRCVFIGAGAIILPRLEIGENSVIGAGAVVTKDAKSRATLIGNPGKEIS